MERYFNYAAQYDRQELILWLQGYSEEEWQKLIEFAISNEHKKDFKYDEKNALIVTKKFLRLRELSTGQLKMAAWSYNIVQRIEGLKANQDFIEQVDKNEDNFNQPLRHFTLRVAWHDNQWNGTVCNRPRK